MTIFTGRTELSTIVFW